MNVYNLKLSILDPKPYTPNTKPKSQNPKPKTPDPEYVVLSRRETVGEVGAILSSDCSWRRQCDDEVRSQYSSCMCVSVLVYVCDYVYVCVCMCICVSVSVSVSVWTCLGCSIDIPSPFSVWTDSSTVSIGAYPNSDD